VTEEVSYVGAKNDMVEVVSAIQARREERDHWKAAHSDLRTEFITSIDQYEERLDKVAEDINQLNKAWKSELAKSNRNHLLGLVVAGAIGYMAGR
jgi:uncharacterized coiled-coil DUF342 family protein